MRARPPALVAALALSLGLLAAPPAASQVPQVPPIPLGGDGLARISPELAGVPVDGDAAVRVQVGYDLAYSSLQLSTSTRVAAENELLFLAERETELSALITATALARKQAAVALAEDRRLLRELAIDAYVLSADHDAITRAFDIERTVEIGATQVLSGAAQERVLADAHTHQAELTAANGQIDAAQAERLANRERAVQARATREQAAADEVRFLADAGRLQYDLGQARAVSRVSGTDFTLVALDAFVRAANASGDCQMPWWALAGISRVEGRHGTYSGGSLGPDGQVSVPIIGIPLSGANNTALIGDTDGGALDGDPVFDRAVGPMQFIPSTWARWATDGDGDGDADPQNMYDAVASAAAYLCHGRTIRTEADLRAGYFSYNRSEAYVETVLSYAYNYANLRIPDPPPPPAIPPAYPTLSADPQVQSAAGN